MSARSLSAGATAVAQSAVALLDCAFMPTTATTKQTLQSPSATAYLTVPELAQRMRVNMFTVYHLLKDAPERLPRVTRLPSGGVRFPTADVQAWFDSLRVKANTRQPPLHGAVVVARRRSSSFNVPPLERRNDGSKSRNGARADQPVFSVSVS
jgi:predicted DNA-binding transcriptional regulator AlpA